MVMLIASSVISSVLAANFKYARDVASITLADSYTSRGIASGEHDRPCEAVLWFAGAAGVAKGDARRVRDNLRRMDSYRQRVLQPIAKLWLKGVTISSVQFASDSSYLLCEAGRRSEVWDFKNDRRWQLSEVLPNVTSSSVTV